MRRKREHKVIASDLPRVLRAILRVDRAGFSFDPMSLKCQWHRFLGDDRGRGMENLLETYAPCIAFPFSGWERQASANLTALKM
jgi:hypothetical protein